MNKKTLAALAILAALAFFSGYLLGGAGPGGQVSPADPHAHAENNAGQDQAETIWTCSMHPQIRLPEPGQCPICFMDLIPVESGGDDTEAVSLRQAVLSESARKLARVALATVERRDLSVKTRMLGKVDYDETRQGAITAWMDGRIDRMHVDFTGQFVKRGRAMVTIYSPELLTAQAELIQAVKAVGDLSGSKLDLVRETAKRTEKAAREKLRLLGLSLAQIDAVVQRGAPSDQIVLTAPMSGVVTAKEVDEGMYVKTGSVIYRIADLSRVWVVLDAYESDLPWVRLGKVVDFTAEAFPGKIFEGKVVFIDPVVDPVKRTVRVRLEAPNPDYELKPGMFVSAVQQSPPASEPSLVIPASAPLITGKRAVVYVAAPGQDGVYEGREIVLGPRAGDFYVVKSGLAQGEQVVTRGNFKIDSALQIQAKPSMMNPGGGAPAPAHDHGRAKAENSDMEMDEPSFFAAPGGFIAQLSPLIEDYQELAAAVDGGGLAASRQAFMDFHQTIGSVDAAALEGDAALAFKELSMLLANDSLIGAEAETMGNARFEFSQVKRNYERLYADFGLESAAREIAMAKSVPEAFKAQLGEVFEAYIPLRKALSGDDFDAAKAAAGGVSRAVTRVDMGLLPHEPHMLWMEHLQRINQGLSAIAEASDIAAARAGFEPLSVGLAEAMKALGANTDTPVFQLFCPMAFDNKGAIWLQTHEAIENPYFGAAMFACGEVQARIGR